MRTILRIMLALVLAQVAPDARAFDSASGNFSFEPPADWKPRPSGLPYRPDPIFEAPKETEGIRPRLQFGEEKLDQGDSLEVFVKESVKSLSKWERFKLLARSNLQTKAGQAVVKLSYERYSQRQRSLQRCVSYLTIVRGNTVLMVDVEAGPATPSEVFAQAEAAVLALKSK